MKKILIINVYSYKNRGDSGIVTSMLSLLETKMGSDVEFSLMSPFYESNLEFYNASNVFSIPDATENIKGRSMLLKYMSLLSKFLFIDTKTLEFFKNADLVISAGGGYIYSSKRGPLGFGLLNVALNFYYAHIARKPLILFPVSIGPLKFKLDKILIKKFIKTSTQIFVRESQSFNNLKELGIIENVDICHDIAFTLKKSDFKIKEIKNNSLINIGISVLDWRFSRSNATKSDIEKYLDKITLSLKQTKLEYKIYIFPQVDVSEKDTDLFVSNKLQKKLGASSRVIPLKSVFNPEDVVSLYSKMDLFIGSRMHSCIFSLAAGVPTICLAYQFKSLGTFELLGLEEDCFDVESFRVKELQKKIKQKVEALSKCKKEVKQKVKAANALTQEKVVSYFDF